MRSFSDIAGQQSTSLAVVAPGIAEALFATALGLFAAIPAVIAYNRFSFAVNRLEARLQRFADGFHATLSRELEVEGGGRGVSDPPRNGEGGRPKDGGGVEGVGTDPSTMTLRAMVPLPVPGRNFSVAMGPILGPGRRGRRSPMAEINVTPMVDVMLVLLIIFMVTAPLLATGVQVDLPESKAAALDQDQRPVSISMDAQGNVFVDDLPVPEGALPVRLGDIARAATEPGGPRIFLRADRTLDYGRVMAVMGEINRAGLRRVAMVSIPPGEAR
jgi:biopolymer transport protein TolR